MKKVTFIHAADLHLDSPMAGLKYLPANILNRLRESTFAALKKIVDAAIYYEVDFVIIAGDLYDGEDRSLKAQSRFRTEMERLNANNIPVYAIHGNHDHLGGSWVKMQMPENVHIFGGRTEAVRFQSKSGASVYLYGFSYPTRHIAERKIDTYEKIGDGDYHIGILHGNDGSSSDHGNYCPFSARELADKHFDYWALGHIHKRAVLSEYPPIVYPGNIQGRNRKETGEKGCYLVALNEMGANLEFIETNDVVWMESEISAKAIPDFAGIYQLCINEKEKMRREGEGVLLSIVLTDVNPADQAEMESIHGSLLELLQDGEEEETSFVWVNRITVEEDHAFRRDELAREADFYGELFSLADGFDDTAGVLEPLYGRLPGRKFLAKLSKEEENQLLEEAERMLVNLLRSK